MSEPERPGDEGASAEVGPPAAPPGISPATRWALVVLLPAAGFLVGCVVAFRPLAGSLAAVVLLALLGGVVGAALSLVLGLTIAPWLPAGEREVEEPPPPAAVHPPGVSWIGPAAALLVGLGLGVPLGSRMVGQYPSRYYRAQVATFTVPAGTALVCGLLLVLLLLLHETRGVAPVAARAPLHRVVGRSLLAALLAGLLAGSGWMALAWASSWWPIGSPLTAFLGGVGAAAAGAALMVVSDALSGRVPPSLRCPTLFGVAALVPLAAFALGGFAANMGEEADPIAALGGVLDDALRLVVRSPQRVAQAIACVAPPVALLAAARAGVLPYFGQRAPWPVSAQLPLAWLCGVLGLSLSHFLVGEVRADGLAGLFDLVSLAALALVIGLALADPLERRLARRLATLTGG